MSSLKVNIDTLIQIDTMIHKVIADKNIYETILTEQHETYEFLMFGFMGILGLLFGISLYLNFFYFEKKIEASVQKELNNALGENKEVIDEKFKTHQKTINEKLTELETKIKELKNSSEAGVMHLQAIKMMQERNYVDAYRDFISASEHYSKTSDKTNLIRVLKLIGGSILPRLFATDLENHENSEEFDFQTYLKEIEEKNINGELTDPILDIKKEYNAAKKRTTLK